MASDSGDGIKKERDPILMVGFIVLVLAFAVVCGVYVKDEYFSAEENPQAFMGSTVRVDYTGSYYDFFDSDDGVVFDTSLWIVANGDFAKSYEFTMRTESNYSPLSFTIGISTTYLDAFMNSVIGLRSGESARICIAPADGYGELTMDDLWDDNGTIDFSLTGQTTPRFDTMRLDAFKEVYNDGNNVAAGQLYSSPYGNGWNVRVISVDSVNVMFENVVEIGDYPMSDNVTVSVTNVSDVISFDYVINDDAGPQPVPAVGPGVIVSDGSDPTIFAYPNDPDNEDYINVKLVKIFYDGEFYFITAMDKTDSNIVILKNTDERTGMYLFFEVKVV